MSRKEDEAGATSELDRLRAERDEALDSLAHCQTEAAILSQELAETQHLLDETQDRYAHLYHFAPLGYITLSQRGIILESNATFAAITGTDQRALLNTPFNLFLASGEDLGRFLTHLSLCRKGGGKVNTDLKLKQHGGGVLHVQISSIPVADYATRAVVLHTAVIDVSERKQAEETRDETRRLLQLIMDSAPVPIGYLDTDERFVFVNAEYLRKFELNQQAVLGHSFQEVHGPEVEGLIEGRLQRGIAGEASAFETSVNCGHSGKSFFLRINIAPDCPPGSLPCGIVVVATDLSEQKQHMEEIHQAKEAAEKANKAKSRFLANMSHELRTPLNSVIGMLQLLLNGYAGPLEEKQLEYASKAAKSAQALVGLINDVLDLSKVEAGKLSLDMTTFSVRECVADAVDMFQPEAMRKGIELEFSMADDVPGAAMGDPGRLRQVLVNLLGNAVKFTERGKVSLEVRAGKQLATGKREITFTVTDTGIGIAESERGRLFRPFSQLDESNTRRFGGTGLGLAISRRIVEMMGGTISVESKEGAGSTFSFTVPLEEVAGAYVSKPEAAAPTAVAQAPVKEAPRILVAEDDPMSSELLLAIFEDQGYQMKLARTGREAVEMWEKQEFDLIIMDIQMPKMDGITATRIIREREKPTGRRTPILAMTAHAYPEERERCVQAGMDEFLTKPLDLKKGIEVIRALTGKRKLQQPANDR